MEQKESNAQRFLNAYARIETDMYDIIRETKYVPFSQMISRAARENIVVSAHQNDLRQYHELRNAIVHERGKECEIIAEPCDSVTEDIENIADLLEARRDIMSIASSPVITVEPDDPVSSAYTKMRKMKSSKIPVYEQGVYTGLVTMEEIAGWALKEEKKDNKVSSVMTSSKNERVLFVRENTTLQNVMRSFESSMKHGTTLLAVIITAHGTSKEKPLGIITVADLPKLLTMV